MNAKLLLLLSSLCGVILLVLIAEFGVRAAFPHINFQGTEAGLVRDRVFGETFGWAADATGTVFGTPVTIGGDGFRQHRKTRDTAGDLLLIGDSVTFGVGVEADSTFAGILQDHFSDFRILNTACIGYGARHYRDVVEHVVKLNPAIRQALLFYSLNDLYPDQPLAVSAKPWLRFVRLHSKLYLLMKNLLFDRSRTYFDFDYGFYHKGSSEMEEAIGHLSALSTLLTSHNIPLTVVFIPYEYQVRMQSDSLLLPQIRMKERLATLGIPTIDLFPWFTSHPRVSRDYYLYGDHMHLSELGHRTVAAALVEHLAQRL